MSRLHIRPSFTDGDRRLVVYFYTTSDDKFLQARYLFDRSGFPLRSFARHPGYEEDEETTSEQLLTGAIEELLESLGEATFLFVEDTSVVIPALATLDQPEFPGLKVKDWYASTTFPELDGQLRARQDRTAIVRSDIALHVPQLDRPVFFRGATTGRVADRDAQFEANLRHPWLRPDSFNGWFIPDGAELPLGAMSIEESLEHDFRAKALECLIDRLEEYSVVLNAQPPSYTRRQRIIATPQPQLWPREAKPAFVVIGPTCAGKSTFADRTSLDPGLTWIEASDIVRTLDVRLAGEDAGQFAERVLRAQGADIVARRIIDRYLPEVENGFVVSGFRTIEELLTLREAVPHTQVILIEANVRIRFERYLARRRTNEARDLRAFRQLDAVQASFGLLSVATHVPDVRLRNEMALSDYLATATAIARGESYRRLTSVTTAPKRAQILNQSQLRRCLQILDASGRPLSTDEIQRRSTSARGGEIRHNNANKVLKAHPALARRHSEGTSRVRYEILPAGRAYLAYLNEFVRTV